MNEQAALTSLQSDIRSFLLQVEWHHGFSLFVIGAANDILLKQIHERLADQCLLQVRALERTLINTPEDFAHNLASLLDTADTRVSGSVNWLEAHAFPSNSDWNDARASFLQRLNEHRSILEQRKQTIILCLPLDFLPRFASLAPDLWSVRASVVYLPAERALELKTSEAHSAENEPVAIPRSGKLPASLQNRLTNWLNQVATAEAAKLHPREGWALHEQLKPLSLKAASQAASATLELARARAASSDPIVSQLDLSISLDNLGQIQQDSGDLAAARAAFEESLQLRRQLAALQPDQPQALRDLSVSLDNLGGLQYDSGELAAARAAFEESVQLARNRLMQFGDSLEGLTDLIYALRNLSRLKESTSHHPLLDEAYRILGRIRLAVPGFDKIPALENLLNATAKLLRSDKD